MDAQSEVRRFLTSCRGRLSPEQAGVPVFEGTRRVPGLRREEVAHLAGVSVDYYTRLERGRVAGASDTVLDSVARALQLTDVEREHLFHLARALRGITEGQSPQRSSSPRVRPEILCVVQAITLPAFVHNSGLDVLAANDIGRAIYPPSTGHSAHDFNHVRFQFLDPRARGFYRDWEATARYTIAVLRAATAREPGDDCIAALVREVSETSDRFRRLWSSTHDVERLRNGLVLLQHPVVGELDFAFEAFDLAGDPGLVLVVYTPLPATDTADTLRAMLEK